MKGKLFIPIRIYSNRRIYIYIYILIYIYIYIYIYTPLLRLLHYFQRIVRVNDCMWRLSWFWWYFCKFVYLCFDYEWICLNSGRFVASIFPLKSSTNIKVVMFRSLNSVFFPGDLMKRTIKFFACWVPTVYKEISVLICYEQDIGPNNLIIWVKIGKIFWDNSVFVELPNC